MRRSTDFHGSGIEDTNPYSGNVPFSARRCCVIPCLLSIFVYGAESPTYKATEGLWNQLFTEAEAVVEADKLANLYEEKTIFVVILERKTGVSCLYVRKSPLTQELVDFESDILGIPTAPVTSAMIGVATLGTYDNESNQMWIHTEHLANSSPRDIANTTCHEFHHSKTAVLLNLFLSLLWGPVLVCGIVLGVKTWNNYAVFGDT